MPYLTNISLPTAPESTKRLTTNDTIPNFGMIGFKFKKNYNGHIVCEGNIVFTNPSAPLNNYFYYYYTDNTDVKDMSRQEFQNMVD